MTQSLRAQKYRMHGAGVCVQGEAGFGENEEEGKNLGNLLQARYQTSCKIILDQKKALFKNAVFLFNLISLVYYSHKLFQRQKGDNQTKTHQKALNVTTTEDAKKKEKKKQRERGRGRERGKEGRREKEAHCNSSLQQGNTILPKYLLRTDSSLFVIMNRYKRVQLYFEILS